MFSIKTFLFLSASLQRHRIEPAKHLVKATQQFSRVTADHLLYLAGRCACAWVRHAGGEDDADERQPLELRLAIPFVSQASEVLYFACE